MLTNRAYYIRKARKTQAGKQNLFFHRLNPGRLFIITELFFGLTAWAMPLTVLGLGR